MKHLKLYIVLGILVCMALCCTITVKALAAGDGELSTEPEEQTTYAYDITITPPSGWYLNTASVQVKITGDTWSKVEIQMTGLTSWQDITQSFQNGSADYTITANGTYTVRVTDPNGDTHEAEQYVECIDGTPPIVRAGIRDKLLHTEATDTQSGVAGIMVDGSLYTTLKNGALDLRIEDYKNAGETISVIALDNVGNLSDETLLENPYYSTTPPDTSTPAPTSTPTIIYTGDPNAEQPSSSGQSTSTSSQSSQSTSSGTSTQSVQTVTVTPEPVVVTPEPVETATVTPEPTVETVEELSPTPYEGTGFRGTSDFVTRDMLYDQFTNKLFVTVETRDGGVFYLVIDYDKPLDEDGEVYETYFLNAVDGSDLTAFLPETETEVEETPEPEVCTCTDKCAVGSIDTSCSICRVNMSECTGVEATPEPVVTEEPAEEPEQSTNNLGGMAVVLLLLVVAAGGAAIFYMKKKQGMSKPTGGIDLDDFEYADDEEDEGEEYETGGEDV